MIEDNYFDECGNKIEEGDLIRVWHFRGRHRRKIHYMYHIVTLEEFNGKKYFGGKSYHVAENKSHYWLRAVADKETRVIHGYMVIDTKDAMRELSQTRKPTPRITNQ